jgi:hypothetical protein
MVKDVVQNIVKGFSKGGGVRREGGGVEAEEEVGESVGVGEEDGGV